MPLFRYFFIVVSTSGMILDTSKLIGNLADMGKQALELYSGKASRYSCASSGAFADSRGFLMTITFCFYKRVLQCWGSPGKPALETLFRAEAEWSNENERINSDSASIPAGESARGGSAKRTEDADRKVIDKQAYKVPYPASSGGRFTATGQVVCFGAAKLCTSLAAAGTAEGTGEEKRVRSNSQVFQRNASEGIPGTASNRSWNNSEHDLTKERTNRSYADMLVTQRDETYSRSMMSQSSLMIVSYSSSDLPLVAA